MVRFTVWGRNNISDHLDGHTALHDSAGSTTVLDYPLAEMFHTDSELFFCVIYLVQMGLTVFFFQDFVALDKTSYIP